MGHGVVDVIIDEDDVFGMVEAADILSEGASLRSVSRIGERAASRDEEEVLVVVQMPEGEPVALGDIASSLRVQAATSERGEMPQKRGVLLNSVTHVSSGTRALGAGLGGGT
jgi:hypothetical protein